MSGDDILLVIATGIPFLLGVLFLISWLRDRSYEEFLDEIEALKEKEEKEREIEGDICFADGTRIRVPLSKVISVGSTLEESQFRCDVTELITSRP